CDHPGQWLAGDPFEFLEIRGKGLIKPDDNARGVCDLLRPVNRIEIKRAHGYSAQKAFFRRNNVPSQLQGGLGSGVGAIVAVVQGNSFDHPFGGLVFSLERGQRQTQNESGLIGRERCRRHGFVLSKGLDHSNRPMGTEVLRVPHPCTFLAQGWEARTRAAVSEKSDQERNPPRSSTRALTICVPACAKPSLASSLKLCGKWFFHSFKKTRRVRPPG